MPLPRPPRATKKPTKDRAKVGGSGKARAPAQAQASDTQDEHGLSKPDVDQPPVPLLQSMLSAFVNAFPNLLQADQVQNNLVPTLQTLKKHLYHRDFAAAFGSGDLLAAYAARWSAARALAYLPIFKQLVDLIPGLDGRLNQRTLCFDSARAIEQCDPPIGVISIGGGAGAELVALAGLASLLPVPPVAIQLDTIDLASWEPSLRLLQRELSAASGASAPVIGHSSLSLSCHTVDALAESSRPLLQDLTRKAQLITIFFTLNELYNVSVAKTQTLLLELTRWTKGCKGVLLCVVDSPGSYSEVTLASPARSSDAEISGPRKKYPMRWLLDHALMTTAKQQRDPSDEHGPWEKLMSDESIWYRIPSVGLEYPIDLENMRYQIHTYRRV